MDFAIQMGSTSTVIYKKNDGIVLNEPAKIAYTREQVGKEKKGKKPKFLTKVVAVGAAAKRMQDRSNKSILIESPVLMAKIADVELAKKYFAEV